MMSWKERIERELDKWSFLDLKLVEANDLLYITGIGDIFILCWEGDEQWIVQMQWLGGMPYTTKGENPEMIIGYMLQHEVGNLETLMDNGLTVLQRRVEAGK